MSTNLRVYHKVLKQLRQWWPDERVSRQRNMALLVTGLHASKAVHLPLIVRTWPLAGTVPSLVNRLRRFLDNPRVDVFKLYTPVAQEIMAGLNQSGVPLRLLIDCTKIGQHFRLMTISVAYRKRSLPLVWSVHRGSKGHTTIAEQLKLFHQVRRLIPHQRAVWVMGDTGFQTTPLLQWLARQGWHFVIRQQGRILVQSTDQRWRKINQFDLQPGQTRIIGWVRLTRKYKVGWYWLVLHWEKGEEEPWYLVSDRPGHHAILKFYRVRMWTEEMYGDMKGHGFDMEATRLDDEDRIARLVLGICITFVWLITLGSWVVKRGLRAHVDVKSRRDKSYFRIGWDWLERCLSLAKPIPIRFKPYP